MRLVSESDHIAHYGIKGQKWGIRRYRNADGSLTPEGKRRAKEEYKKDNDTAFKIGREATINAYAYGHAKKQVDRTSKKYAKNPTDKNKNRLELAKKALPQMERAALFGEQAARANYDSLVKKYGKDAISDIKRSKNGAINERVITKGQAAYTIAMSTIGTLGLAMLGSPVGFVTYPKSAHDLGVDRYNAHIQQIVKSEKSG